MQSDAALGTDTEVLVTGHAARHQHTLNDDGRIAGMG
jgi:hypothetical protein